MQNSVVVNSALIVCLAISCVGLSTEAASQQAADSLASQFAFSDQAEDAEFSGIASHQTATGAIVPPGDEQRFAATGATTRANNKCTPMFNLASHVQHARNLSSLSGAVEATTPVSQRNFSFGLPDITMPVSPPNGSINSALKFLGTFGSQLDASLDSADDIDETTALGDNGEPLENAVKFVKNSLHINGLNLTMLSVHLPTIGEPKFGFGLVIRNTTLSGRFSYNGPLALTGSQLSGFYRMSIDSIYLAASSNLTKIVYLSANNQQQQQQLAGRQSGSPKALSSLVTNDFQVNISNMGHIDIGIYDSSDMSKASSNFLLRMLQRFLQKTIKRTYYTFEGFIKSALERESKIVVDCELTRLSLPLGDKPHLFNSSYQHDLALMIGGEISSSQLDRVALPDFLHQQALIGTQARVQFYNGTLTGLDHLKFNEETRVKLQNQHLFVNSSVGWTDLNPYYSWNLTLGTSSKSPMSRGFVSFKIKTVSSCLR